MRFTVSQSSLADALAIVQKGIASASTLPILSGVLIKAEDGVLEFQTSNYTISIRHRVAARVDEPGRVVVPCKMLASITKTLPDAPVNFVVEDRQVSITCAKSSFRLSTLDAADFPEFPTLALERSVELPTDILSEMVSRVWRVTSTDKNRQVLTGVQMTVENNMLRLVATDAYRLAVCDTQVETSSLEGSFELIVPSDAFNDALSIAPAHGTITVGATDNQVVFMAENTTYVARRIEGTFPDYKGLLPDTCSTSVNLDVSSFNAVLKRVTVVAPSNSAVRFDVDTDANTLTLSAYSSDQDQASETIETAVEGTNCMVGFNYSYIFGCLNALGHEKEITLELTEGRPGVFKSYDKINYIYLVMPVRV